MCPVQTTYTAEHIAGFEGQRVDFGLVDIISKAAEDSDINFGRAVVRGTADNQAILPSASGQAFLGVTEYTTAWAANASDVHLYQENREMNILDFGRIFVVCEDGCVPGDDVFFRHTTGTGTTIGAFRTDADTATADQVSGASWESTTSAGDIGLIKLGNGLPVVAALTLLNTVTATSGAITLLTQITQFDTTLGASTATLADGFEGQFKTLEMTVDGGDMVITPANLRNGTTLTLNDVGDTFVLRFVDGEWEKYSEIIVSPAADIIVATSGAITLDTLVSLFDTTAGVSTATLADGAVGQRKILKMKVDGGNQVVTPANLFDGTTITFDDINDSCELIFEDSTWQVIGTPTATVA